MGLLTGFRRLAAATIRDVLRPPIDINPPRLTLASGENATETVYTSTTQGLRIAIFQDIPEAPWTWTVEDASDSRLVAFHSGAPSVEDAAREVSRWLLDSGRLGFDVPARAA